MHDEFYTRFSDIAATDLLDAIPHGVAVIDWDLKIVLINEFLEKLIGMVRTNVIGVCIDTVLRSDITPLVRTFLEALNSGETLILDSKIVTHDHRKLPLQFTISPLRDRTEVVVGLVIVLSDLSPVVTWAGFGSDFDEIDSINGQSPKMREIFDLIPLIAHTDATVLITGENGTGKSKVAEAIHKRSNRVGKPLIKINCGALPESLLELELFGYIKGAFTGAVRNTPGMFHQAKGGTLFLAEIGEMPLRLQIKLLSVLDNREFFPLGDKKKINTDVRIIASTNRPLKLGVATCEFHEDLYNRLSVLALYLPPLRERETDTYFLLSHFLRIFAAQTGNMANTFSKEALSQLMAYQFPGNIRELQNIVEHCVNICHGQQIEVEHLPKYMFSEIAPIGVPGGVLKKNELISSQYQDTERSWLAIEKDLIIETLTQTRGNRTKAAEILGWGRTTLWRKLKIHGLMILSEQCKH